MIGCMTETSKPSSKDPDELLYEAFGLSSNELEERLTPMELPDGRLTISKYLSEIGRRGGLKGGPARAKKLSAKRRRQIAKKAANTRWGKYS